MSKTTITDKQLKWQTIKRKARELRGTTVTVGVHDDAGAHADGDLSVAHLAAIHEFGTDRIPERSFMRATFDANRDKYTEMIKQAAHDVVAYGLGVQTAARKLGVIASSDVKRTIQDGIEPDLADATKRARDDKAAHGGGLASMAQTYTPLIDSGQLIASITFRVD